MNLSRRKTLLALAAFPLSNPANSAPSPMAGDAAASLVGTWHVTSAVTSVVVSIEPQGESLVILIENGAHSLARSKWKKMDGGLGVEGFPMFRLWRGRHADEARAEMEPIPEDVEISGGIRQFPRAFFMRRVAASPKQALGRAIPKGWEKEAPDPEWDQTAGRRRGLGK